MIIIKMNGGLGNQLQQYALYEKLKSLGKEVKLDDSWFAASPKTAVKRELELKYFPQVSFECCTQEEIASLMGNRSVLKKVMERLKIAENPTYVEKQMYDENLFSMDRRILEGYWACEAYYADILPLLRKKLEFPPSANPENEKQAQIMSNCNSVSIHIRRGDYLTEENRKMFGGICTDRYYDSAISYVKEKVKDAIFFVFSDDPEYASQKYKGKEYRIVDINHGRDSFYDMYLMSRCRHNICANSTFSFWGARLNAYPDRLAVRPLKQKNCGWYLPEEMKKLWKGWILIDEEGKQW